MNEQGDTGAEKRKHPFFIVDNAAVDRFGLKAMELALYVAIVRHANRETRIAFPSMKTLAESAGMAERSVKRILPLLETKQLIRVIRNGTRGYHYEVLDPHDGRGAGQKEDRESPIRDTESQSGENGLGTESPQPPMTISDRESHIEDRESLANGEVGTQSPQLVTGSPTNKSLFVVDPDSDPDSNQQQQTKPVWSSAALEIVQAEWQGMGLAGDLKRQLFEVEPAYALALTLHLLPRRCHPTTRLQPRLQQHRGQYISPFLSPLLPVCCSPSAQQVETRYL